jgi:hypothetical protein
MGQHPRKVTANVTATPPGADGSSVPGKNETELIVSELKALRKGRGIWASDLEKRTGPLLRELAMAQRGPADLRTALSSALGRCAARLPDEVRLAALASLGLAPGTTHMAYFGDRVAWLVGQIERDSSRTGLRRIDEEAEPLLAEETAKELARIRGRAVGAGEGWYLDEFRTRLKLDGPAPEAHEYRRIVAVQPGVSDVTVSVDVPGGPDQRPLRPAAEVVFGGQLVRVEEPSLTRTQFVIRLPGPLQPGDKHEFEIIVRVPSADLMRPHYIFTPELECHFFDLRVRFDQQRLPTWVRLVDGETVRMFDPPRPGTEQVAIDSSGEAHVSFTRPALYLGYGLQWQPR